MPAKLPITLTTASLYEAASPGPGPAGHGIADDLIAVAAMNPSTTVDRMVSSRENPDSTQRMFFIFDMYSANRVEL